VLVAEGVANVATDASMIDTTGFLAGSITKVMTATLALQCVERGQLDLDARVTAYLPELRLGAPANVDALRVRHLLNHTNAIDGDVFWPNDDVKGRDALKSYVDALHRCSMLFEPGEYISYSNAGMVVLGRVLEVVTGRTYHHLVERDIYEPAGMLDSCTSAEQAILRKTAVGHFFDPKTTRHRRTDMFMLPESWSACGSTPIVTLGDLLAFARSHIDDGVAPTGRRLLSAELTRQMRAVSAEMRSVNGSVLGLGWPLLRFGDTTVLFHSGASPGGAAILLVVPERRFAFATFGNSSSAGLLQDGVCRWMLCEYLGLKEPTVTLKSIQSSGLDAYAGTYRSNQFRVDVARLGDQLEETVTFEPLDETQSRIFTGFAGGFPQMPPRRLTPVGDGLFAPAGIPLDAFSGVIARRMLVSFHGGTSERPDYRLFGGKMSRRAQTQQAPL
jgi:CubicO group peptidase (beta-lactamase class C family)